MSQVRDKIEGLLTRRWRDCALASDTDPPIQAGVAKGHQPPFEPLLNGSKVLFEGSKTPPLATSCASAQPARSGADSEKPCAQQRYTLPALFALAGNQYGRTPGTRVSCCFQRHSCMETCRYRRTQVTSTAPDIAPRSKTLQKLFSSEFPFTQVKIVRVISNPMHHMSVVVHDPLTVYWFCIGMMLRLRGWLHVNICSLQAKDMGVNTVQSLPVAALTS